MSQTIRLLFASALLNSICWIILIPVWQYPDEQAHFAQIQYIAEIGGIPAGSSSLDTSYEVELSEKILGTERDNLGNNQFTYHPQYHLPYTNSLFGYQESKITSLAKSQRSNLVKNEATLNPPLYYFLGAAVYKLFENGNLFTRVYAIRIMSALIFMLTILITYKSGQLIFKGNKILPIALAAIIAYKPMLVFASSGVLPDTLTNFLFTLFTFISIKIILENISVQKIISLFVVIVLGALTRQQFLITLFILPFLILEQFLFNKKSRKIILISFTLALLTLYILSFFIWSLRYIREFDFPESSQKITTNPLYHLTYIDHLKWTTRHSLAEVWPWYWGIYKWLSLSLPPMAYRIINRLIPFAVLGLVLKLLEVIFKKEFKKNQAFFILLIMPTIYFLALTTFDFFYRKNNGFSFGIQGRYFFPTIVFQMALLLIGFNKTFELSLKRYAKYGLFLLVLTFMIFNIFSLTYVSSTYYDFSNLKTFVVEASQYKPVIIKGYVILLIPAYSFLLQALFLFYFAKDILKLKS